MGKKLIITEKPSVAQDFAKVFGVSGRKNGYIENDEYVITWCVGHLVEMVYPEAYDIKYKKWKLEDLPFLPKTYKYDVIQNVKSQYDIVHKMLYREDIDTVYWAGDSGKEGQTIEENIRNFGGVRRGMTELRVWIDSQTEEEIRRGIREAKPMSDYANLGKSGIMRTIEDYAMGINFSRVMSVKYGRLLNTAAGTNSYRAIAVGRVMTCVLGMVVIREREIRDFVETPFYRVIGSFAADACKGEWRAAEGSAYFESPLLYRENGFRKKEDAMALIASLAGVEAVVSSIEKGKIRKKAPLLFNLAELQAECARRFKISPDETLQAAQELYEKKMTTYPRTDARVLTTAVAKEIGRNLGGLKNYEPTRQYTERILESGAHRRIAGNQYTDDSKVTDHYAIIPTGQVAQFPSLTALQQKIFDLIVRRFLSVFYPPAVYQTVKLTVAAGREKFFASAKEMSEAGYLEILDGNREEPEKEENFNSGLMNFARDLKVGDTLAPSGYEIKEGRTTPPKRYTSGSMVLAMENAGQLIEDEELRALIKGTGIGTSATRAEIIKKLVRIGYLALNKKTQVLTPQTLGEMVYEVVNMTVPQLLNPKMTASWEKGLDGITRGIVDFADYRGKLEDFIRRETVSMIQTDLTGDLLSRIRPLAGENAAGSAAKHSIPAVCPVCGGTMMTTPFGYGCGNYKRDGKGCRFSIGTIAGRKLSEEEVIDLLSKGRTEVLKGFTSKAKKKFQAALVLSAADDGTSQITFDFSHNEPRQVKGVKCPICGDAILQTPFGFACANYDRKNPDGCQFAVGKIAGVKMKEKQLKELLTRGKTGVINGFVSKKGIKFDASLKLSESGRIAFDFPEKTAPVPVNVRCPKCGLFMKESQWYYECSCGFRVGHTVAKVKLPEKIMTELFETGRTKEKIAGFTARSGNLFDAHLRFADDKISFDFENADQTQVNEKEKNKDHGTV